MKDHQMRRKIIREWMTPPKDKRQTEEQVVGFAERATQQNEFHRSRRDPDKNVECVFDLAQASFHIGKRYDRE